MPDVVTHARRTEADPFYDGPPRCTCGRYWPCEAVVTHPEPVEQPSGEARRIGVMAMVEVGCKVYAVAPDESDYEPRGGVCVAIDERRDPETGEVQRRYTTVRVRGRLVVEEIDEIDVRPWTVHIPKPGEFAPIIGALCGEVYNDLGKPHEQKGRLILPLHGDRIEWAKRLYAVAMGVAA